MTTNQFNELAVSIQISGTLARASLYLFLPRPFSSLTFSIEWLIARLLPIECPHSSPDCPFLAAVCPLSRDWLG